MAVVINSNYNDKTTLDQYYPIIKENLELLAKEEERIDKVKLEEVPTDSVGTAELKNKSVTGAKIANKTISSDNIVDYTIGQNQLAQGAVANNRIQNGAVDSRTIADEAVTTEKIYDAAVTTDKISDNSITSEKIANGSITTYKIKYGAVTPDRLSFYEYSSAPQEIGSYEGETVYRMIFHEDFEQNNSIWTDKAWSPLLHNQNLFNDINKIFIINGLAFLKYSSTPCYIDDPVVHLHGAGCNFDWSEDQYNANYEGIYGYIEFVTPADNIKTQE